MSYRILLVVGVAAVPVAALLAGFSDRTAGALTIGAALLAAASALWRGGVIAPLAAGGEPLEMDDKRREAQEAGARAFAGLVKSLEGDLPSRVKRRTWPTRRRQPTSLLLTLPLVLLSVILVLTACGSLGTCLERDEVAQKAASFGADCAASKLAGGLDLGSCAKAAVYAGWLAQLSRICDGRPPDDPEAIAAGKDLEHELEQLAEPAPEGVMVSAAVQEAVGEMWDRHYGVVIAPTAEDPKRKWYPMTLALAVEEALEAGGGITIAELDQAAREAVRLDFRADLLLKLRPVRQRARHRSGPAGWKLSATGSPSWAWVKMLRDHPASGPELAKIERML